MKERRFFAVAVAVSGRGFQGAASPMGLRLLHLLCRELGNRAGPPGQFGYGKAMVEDVTLTKSAGVPVKERKLPK